MSRHLRVWPLFLLCVCALLGPPSLSACFPPLPEIECLPCPCPAVGFQCENNVCVKVENLGKSTCLSEKALEEKPTDASVEKIPEASCVPTDEDCTVPNQQGECTKGKLRCEKGSLVCQSTYQPEDEICNGKDDDCNGQIDDNILIIGKDCVVDGKKGECIRGTRACVAGSLQCQPTHQPTTKPASVCDGKDNDCDGYIDCWPVSFGGDKDEVAKAITLDKTGNLYITGSFQGTPTFGATKLTSKGEKDVFVMKLDSERRVDWVVTAGGSGVDIAQAIAIDAQGDLYITGSFQGSATFGQTTLNATGSKEDIFVAKVDKLGKIVWAVSFGDTEQDEGTGITLDKQNNLYITGKYKGNVSFGGTKLTAKGAGFDVFVAKIDIATGQPSLAISLGGDGDDEGYGIACDAQGAIYLAGSFSGNASFGSFPLSSQGKSDGFVAKLDDAGKVLWAAKMGGSLDDIARSVAVDSDGYAYVTGTFQTAPQAEATFDSIKLTSQGGDDGFVARLDPSGKILWATAFGGKGQDTGYFITLDAEENPVITGSFENAVGAVSFGPIQPLPQGNLDVFVAKLNPYGHFLGVASWGGAAADRGYGLAVDAQGNSYIAGSFSGTSSLGKVPLTAQGEDIFVWKSPDLCGLGCVTTLHDTYSSKAKDGPLRKAQFLLPRYIAFDTNGNAFIAQESKIRKIDTTGQVTTLPGVYEGTNFGVFGLAIDPNGHFYITLMDRHRIIKSDEQGNISLLAGSERGDSGWVDGLDSAARFSSPTGIVLDRGGNLYVADKENDAVRKIDPEGYVTRFIGRPKTRTFRDGSFSEALFDQPHALALDAQQKNLYIVESSGCRIRKANFARGTVSLVAGSTLDGDNKQGYQDGQCPDAKFHFPSGIAIAANGDIYIADLRNHRIREIDPSHRVSTFAGPLTMIPSNSQGGFRDGPRHHAEFAFPNALAIDPSGRYLYIVEQGSHRIRRIQIKP